MGADIRGVGQVGNPLQALKVIYKAAVILAPTITIIFLLLEMLVVG